MNTNELIKRWKAEEEIAHIHGWDFSHIEGRYMEEDDLPWDYREEILRYLKPEMRILDIDTGGGEFLLSLNHPNENTAATENYPPNVDLCREKLLPLGIDFRAADGKGVLPFDDASFDMVINRHGDFNPDEIHRVLKPGGLFITQQVGAENDRELVELLCGQTDLPFPDQYLKITMDRFSRLVLRFWMDGSASGPSGSMMWALWCGSPGSSSGSFLISRLITISTGFCGRRCFWIERALLRAKSIALFLLQKKFK